MSLACEAPIIRGPNKGKPATGTRTGARRHYKVGEPVCEPCREVEVEAVAEWGRNNPRDHYYQDPERPLGEWCRAKLHRLEGDNIYVSPSGSRTCRACQDDRNRLRRKSSQCDYCGLWIADDEAWDRHRVWKGNQGRCLTPEEMRARGMSLWPIRWGEPIWIVGDPRRKHR